MEVSALREAEFQDSPCGESSEAMSRLGLSARSFHRVLKVARTIADLARSGLLKSLHVAEALAYRSADRGANRLHEVQPGLTSDLRSPRPLSPQRLWARRSLPEPMNAIDV